MVNQTGLIRSVCVLWSMMPAVLAGVDSPVVAGTYRLCTEPNDLRWDLVRGFEFAWESVKLLEEVREEDPNVSVRTLAVSARLEICDINNLLAIDVSNPAVFVVLDGYDNPVHWRGDSPGDTRHYHRVGVETIVEGTAYTGRMMPDRTIVELPLDPNYLPPSSVSSIKGYLYALYVDEIVKVDIPYDPNGGWSASMIAPDLMLCVDPTTPPCPGQVEYMAIPPSLVPLISNSSDPRMIPSRRKVVSVYSYTTWVKSKTGRPIMVLEDSWYPADVRAAANHVVIETQLFDSKRDKGVRFSSTQRCVRTERRVYCYGWPGQGADDRFDTIRHIIGVHPVEVKVPFVLTKIPVPSVERIMGTDSVP